ncbi:MAG TPA: hypothetical protein PLP21_15815 [Pyrinomonadaceae bacterium]|nr:hypothetical protein [Pyrinomonadaceae bacterium]
MINYLRTGEPLSLQTPEIRDFIVRAVNYLDDPTVNEKPTKPADYRNSDLLEAFDEQFFSKCYLTEQKYFTSWEMDIDHFTSYTERPDLVYEWRNLLPCSHDANMMKPRRSPEGGYLDPCNPDEDVEVEIIYTLSAQAETPSFTPRDDVNVKSVNTAKLLDKVHNGHNKDSKIKTSGIRNAIRKKCWTINEKIIEWLAAEEGSQEKFQAERELRDHLSRTSSFTMLCRSLPTVQRYCKHFFD